MDFETRLVDCILKIEFEELSDTLMPKAEQEYNMLTQLHNNSIEKWLYSLQAKSGECKCGASNVVLGEMLVHIFKKLEHIENLISGESEKYIPLACESLTAKLGHGVIILESVATTADSATTTADSATIIPPLATNSATTTPPIATDPAAITPPFAGDSATIPPPFAGGDGGGSEESSAMRADIPLKDSKPYILKIESKYYVRLNLPLFPARFIPLFASAVSQNALKITKIGERDLRDYDAFIVSVEREMLKARKQQKL